MGSACVREDEYVEGDLAGTGGLGVTYRGGRANSDKPKMATGGVCVDVGKSGRRRGEGRRPEMR